MFITFILGNSVNVRNFLEIHQKIFTNFFFLPFQGSFMLKIKKFDVPLFEPQLLNSGIYFLNREYILTFSLEKVLVFLLDFVTFQKFCDPKICNKSYVVRVIY